MNYTGFANEAHFDKISLYNGDCMELLRQTPDKYYCLALGTDESWHHGIEIDCERDIVKATSG